MRPRTGSGRAWAASAALCGALVVLVALVAGRGGLSPGGTRGTPGRGAATVAARPVPSVSAAPARLAGAIDSAQRVIDDRGSTPRQLADAGLVEQLATLRLDGMAPHARRAALALLDPPAATAMRADVRAAAALAGLTTPRRRLPPWRIAAPPPAPALLGYFRAAEARYGVGWEYLAAIEFVETRFGRVRGRSTAGAQGPMQFMPATWAEYGTGSIDDPRAAVMAAARYLVAAGAPRAMTSALYRYNHSLGYVRAVETYARAMRADPRAFVGYYSWQVVYAYARGTVILPVGYPAAKPIPLGRGGSPRHTVPRHRTPADGTATTPRPRR